MNLDNQRLMEIQKELHTYDELMKTAETISDCISIQNHINLLEKEQTMILNRCDVII